MEKQGKLSGIDSKTYALRRVDEYAPFFVAVRNLKEETVGLENMGTRETMNERINISAEFESAYKLDHVFLVLELTTGKGDTRLFVRGLGELSAHRPYPFRFSVPISESLGSFKSRLHIFSDGQELLHSEIPFDARESSLDRMVARRIRGVDNAPPKPLLEVPPAYPAALIKQAPIGTATLRFTIDSKGNVQDASVENATDPAFGQSSLDAVKQWRFVPRVRGGLAVSTTVDLPFAFAYAGGSSKG